MNDDFGWWTRLFLTALVVGFAAAAGGTVLETLGSRRELRWVAVVAGVAFPALLIALVGMAWAL